MTRCYQSGFLRAPWSYLLSGELPAAQGVDQQTTVPAGSQELENRVTRLEEEVAELRTRVASLRPLNP